MLIPLFLTCISDSVELQIGSLPSRRIRELVKISSVGLALETHSRQEPVKQSIRKNKIAKTECLFSVIA